MPCPSNLPRRSCPATYPRYWPHGDSVHRASLVNEMTSDWEGTCADQLLGQMARGNSMHRAVVVDNMNANQFHTQFTNRTRGLWSKYRGESEWTMLMLPVIWSIGTEAGYQVNCDWFFTCVDGLPVCVGEGEFDYWDCLYHSGSPSTPVVLIEHENKHRGKDPDKDFRKLLTKPGLDSVVSSVSHLRVYIGYGKDSKCSLSDGERFCKLYENLAPVVENEVLLLMGWRQTFQADKERQWHSWLLHGGGVAHPEVIRRP